MICVFVYGFGDWWLHCVIDVPLPHHLMETIEEQDDIHRAEVQPRQPERWSELQTQFFK